VCVNQFTSLVAKQIKEEEEEEEEEECVLVWNESLQMVQQLEFQTVIFTWVQQDLDQCKYKTYRIFFPKNHLVIDLDIILC
jgi:hypothetical protein